MDSSQKTLQLVETIVKSIIAKTGPEAHGIHYPSKKGIASPFSMDSSFFYKAYMILLHLLDVFIEVTV